MCPQYPKSSAYRYPRLISHLNQQLVLEDAFDLDLLVAELEGIVGLLGM